MFALGCYLEISHHYNGKEMNIRKTIYGLAAVTVLLGPLFLSSVDWEAGERENEAIIAAEEAKRAAEFAKGEVERLQHWASLGKMTDGQIKALIMQCTKDIGERLDKKSETFNWFMTELLSSEYSEIQAFSLRNIPMSAFEAHTSNEGAVDAQLPSFKQMIELQIGTPSVSFLVHEVRNGFSGFRNVLSKQNCYLIQDGSVRSREGSSTPLD